MLSRLPAGRRAARARARAAGISTAGFCLISMMPMTAIAADPNGEPNLVPGASLEIDVIARALDLARGQIQPSLGATVYQLQRQTIENQPQGYNEPINQVLLQAPGVAQDSFGQIHVRGDHNGLQFRIDGVQLPEGINVFGQALQTRLAP